MIYFIINPVAGGGRASARAEEIKANMQGDFRILTTSAPMDAANLTRQAIADGAKTVVAVGGDGTVHEVVSGIAGSDCILGVIPSGSGNDFIKSVGIAENLTVAAYLDMLRAGNIRVIDLIKMNDFYFANIGSIGIDAQIVHVSNKLKKRMGKLSYVAAALYCAMTTDPTRLKITADENVYDGAFTLAAICNGWNYGGGFKIAPDAKNDDGYITLCKIDRMSKPAMTMFFPSVMSGKHVKLKEVSFVNCKKVEISYEGKLIVNLDGTLYELNAPLTFEIKPSALRVMTAANDN